MDINEAHQKLEALKEERKQGTKKRPVLELQIRAIQAAINIYYRNHPQQTLLSKNEAKLTP